MKNWNQNKNRNEKEFEYKENNHLDRDEEFENEELEDEEFYFPEEYWDFEFDEEDDEDWTEFDERKSKIRKIFTAAVLVMFVITAMTGVFNVLANFPIDAYLESLDLRDNPQVKELKKSVVMVSGHGEAQKNSISTRQAGSGFNIDPSGKILTNRHVVEDATNISVNFREEEKGFPVEEWHGAPYPNIDMAILEIQGENLPYVELKDDPIASLDKGQDVLIIGNPRGIGSLAVEGELMKIHELSGTPHSILEIDAHIHPGHSGSPVFDAEGEVVGIIYASRETNDGKQVGLAVSLKDVKDLEKFKDRGE
ncbi:S1 family peptidase [Natranaerobius thermophilus]|uniref:Peptidase S1 and S6 chymotrypsin/Hap n=1 Tax=Natranaerobius thermophilus (strain ATCC BAA-1301 / DSM 18059 / JW/NM-WN-LF) TaxID=457570 RepID=B2A739_NATTJ|nr:serine protease [Natranaerobius thermophilus]ACB85630.1 peptidase S1 and S6 chymotrypsin/Hap [Natranaerobius thermophilus JW/NM-WN-LF]